MKVFNSLRAYEVVGLLDGGNFVDEKKVEHTTYAKKGYATEQDCRSDLAATMSQVFSTALSKGGNVVMFNRIGPIVAKENDGLWAYRWHAGFLNFEEPEFTITTEQRYPA